MEMTGHTSGPWTAYTNPPEKNKEHKVSAGGNGSIPICRTGRWDTASAADARLIASAPALLEALEAWQAWELELSTLEYGKVPNAVSAVLAAALTKAAIAQARGEG